MKKLIKSKLFLQVIVASIIATLATAGIVAATSTIGANIVTTGTLGAATTTIALGDLIVNTDTLIVKYLENKVGIGTTTPNWLLQVAGTRPSLALSDTAQTAASNLQHWLLTSAGGNLYVGTSTGAYATSTPAALTILNSGYVGIGTSSPGMPLGITNIETQFMLAYDDTNYSTFGVGSGGDTTIISSGGDISFSDENLATTGTLGAATTTISTGGLIVDTDTLVVDYLTNKVGIGSSTPGAMLSVGPTPTAASATSTIDFSKPCFKMATEDGTVYYLRLDPTQNHVFATSTTSCF